MSRWLDEYESHQVHEQLKKLKDLLQSVAEKASEEPEGIEAHSRLVQIYDLLERRLNTVDPVLISPQTLNPISTHIANTINELGEFQSNGNPAHLVNANNHSNVVLNGLPHLSFQIINPSDLEGLREAVESFRRSASQHERYLRQEVDGLRGQASDVGSQLDELKSEIRSQKARLDQAIATFQEQFSEEQNSRNERWTNAQTTRAEQFSQLITGSEERLTELHSAKERQLDEALKSTAQEAEKVISESKSTFEEFLGGLESYREQAQEIVHVIANTGMAGGYQKAARSAQLAAYFWQFWAIVGMLSFIGVAFYLFVLGVEQVSSIESFLSRAFVTGSFGVLARYSANQANKNRRALWYNQRMQLELASVDPYIVLLDKEKQEEMKQQLFERLFGRGTRLELRDEREEAFMNFPIEVASRLMKMVEDLAKRGR